MFDRTKNFTEPPNRTEPDIFLPNRTGPNRTRYLPQILILLKNITFSASFLVVEAHFYTHLQSMAKSPSKGTFCEIVHFSKKNWRFLNLHDTVLSSFHIIVCSNISSKMTFWLWIYATFSCISPFWFGMRFGSPNHWFCRTTEPDRTSGSAELPNRKVRSNTTV